MAIRFQLRRGNTAENDAFTGALGELTLDTQRKVIRFHDGVTRGGIELGAPSLVAVQRPTASNNYTWFRKYSDGWVEQGGRVGSNVTQNTVNMPIEMTDEYYTLVVTSRQSGYQNAADGVNRNTVMNWSATVYMTRTTSFGVRESGTESAYSGFAWYVAGYAAA